ncbi:hypothetical protein C2S51_015942 [Perilla frutescens var. frutescens]|nr:hypothetical protein C2S51_015942 [Perilla frutescens var. frutescens]
MVIIEKPVNDVGSVDMQFKVTSQPLMSRIRVVQYNSESKRALCSCHMYETEGVLYRHILRIYFHFDVTRLPICYIMSRWCKSARQRHLNDISNYSIAEGNEAVDEMAFVNYVMRITLEVAHDVKNHQQGRKTCLDRIRALKGDVHVMVNKGIPHKKAKARDLLGARADRANIRDPSLAKRRGKTPITSHWKGRKPNPNPPPSILKWPDVEPFVQNDINTERSNEGDETNSILRRTASHDYIPTTSFEDEDASLTQYSHDVNLDELLDVSSLFQIFTNWTVDKRSWDGAQQILVGIGSAKIQQFHIDSALQLMHRGAFDQVTWLPTLHFSPGLDSDLDISQMWHVLQFKKLNCCTCMLLHASVINSLNAPSIYGHNPRNPNSHLKYLRLQMAPRAISQDDVFFVEPWTSCTEQITLLELEHQYLNGNWIPGEDAANLRVIHVVRGLVEQQLEIALSNEEFELKVAQWAERYEMFSWLLDFGHPRCYDEVTNFVDLPNSMWRRVKQVRPAALVYKNEGEEFWAILKELFEVDDPSSGSSPAFSAAAPSVDEIDADDMEEGAFALDSITDVDADDTVDEAVDI